MGGRGGYRSFCTCCLSRVPYVPTKRGPLEKAFDDLYPIGSSDLLVDIGSGDGLVLRSAAKRGARAVGYELNPILVLVSRMLAKSPLISTELADYRYVTFPAETTIVYTFGESRDIKKMYKKAQQTADSNKRQIYFMSFGFKVPGEKSIKSDGKFFLYRIKPLQQ